MKKKEYDPFNFKVAVTMPNQGLKNNIVLYDITFNKHNNITTPKGIKGGIATTCLITTTQSMFQPIQGITVCNPKDIYNPIEGIKKSMKRALEKGFISKEIREQFWISLSHRIYLDYKKVK